MKFIYDSKITFIKLIFLQEMAIYDTGNKIFFKLGQNTDDDDKIQALELIHVCSTQPFLTSHYSHTIT